VHLRFILGVAAMSIDKSILNDILEEKTKSHPCYSGGCQNARIHLPVAPACNISCNYCNRKFDCVNESRPGVTSEILTPEQALQKFLKVGSKLNNLKVVGIAGPGDALANFENTKKTLELIREADADITFCLSTNGLYLPKYAEALARLGVTHVTVTLNTIEPEIGAKIYKEVYFEGVRYTGATASEILLKNQIEGLKLLQKLGIVAKINTVMMKGINDFHIEDVVKKVKEYGVFISNIMQLIPAPGSAFEHMPLTTNRELNDLRKTCGKHLKQMYHCQQCRADAIGTLGQDCSAQFREPAAESEASIQNKLLKVNFTAAVASKDEKLVNQHFGHAMQFGIYRYEGGKVKLLETRDVKNYCNGSSDCGDAEDRLQEILRTVDDCDIILTQRIGYSPQKMLEERGKKVIQTYGLIEEEIRKAAEGYIVNY
jgi:MoaA/NifB/PqqE/SkfB family radical SAM enzyme